MKVKYNKLKTKTFGGENPSISLCLGHVTTKEFNKAFASEGWSGGGRIYRSEIRYEHWVKLKKSWRKATDKDRNPIPVTVSDW